MTIVDTLPATRIRPIDGLRNAAASYTLQTFGRSFPTVDFRNVRQSAAFLARLGDAYASLPSFDVRAVPAFRAMAAEVDAQYRLLTETLGVRVSVVASDPYESVHDMAADVARGRLAVMATSLTGTHPAWSDETNDRFRAVHDAFGHAAHGSPFDRHGEECAFRAHAAMFGPLARMALTSETRGQNGYLISRGEFGPQKVAILPASLRHIDA